MCSRSLHALTIPTPDHGPPIEVDHEIAAATAKVVGDLLTSSAVLRFDDEKRPLAPTDVGVTSSHRVMNAALAAALGAWANQIRVDTPERWQGLERPVMIAVHPLSGVSDPSFDLETGRLCVMASRHQAGFILLSRDHVGDTLRNYVPSAEQAPGRPDVVGRGHDAHLKFWGQLEARDSVVSAESVHGRCPSQTGGLRVRPAQAAGRESNSLAEDHARAWNSDWRSLSSTRDRSHAARIGPGPSWSPR